MTEDDRAQMSQRDIKVWKTLFGYENAFDCFAPQSDPPYLNNYLLRAANDNSHVIFPPDQSQIVSYRTGI